MSAATHSSRPLSVRVSREKECADNSMVEPMSPTGRVMEELGVCIVVVIGLGTPVNLPVFRAGIETELLTRFPRFRSIQVMDESTNNGKPRWVQTPVNMDDHIVVPRLDPEAVASDPEKAVEDYVASLSLLPMDRRRPLWELHFLDFPSSEAASTVVLRLHHSIGDGTSITTLLMASSRSTADPARVPAMPPPPKRTGAIYQREPRPPLSSGDYLALLAWFWSYVVLAWHTLVDVAMIVATILFLSDPRTLFTRADGVEPRARKRFVHRSLSFDDVKLIKTAMNCTINDVLAGVTSAALSQYYFKKSGDTNMKRICLRSLVLVDARPVSTRQTYVTRVETGNRLSSLICPFNIALQDDPLEYVREAKRFMHRKKSSLEVLFTRVVGEFLVKKFGVKKAGAFIFRRFVERTTIIFSNALGPVEHMALCGHPVVFMAPSIYGPPQALTVHYHNYGSDIKVVLAVDDAQFPDCHQLLDGFAEAIRIIKNAAALKTLTTSI
ncbi:wax ester synthase/diacylglycerol acyltransferase 11-like isoform X1 [Triticum urartu]|uniref:Diacylglycerol O-acyltransferase n=1 Tax=Triticum urartu TaxID=4572 RepID=A0A8R7TR38_TRIUA|nr:wax ester synthase/diacylglycerol acyltransferase 11-like isoform X1 [Triticum urartu]